MNDVNGRIIEVGDRVAWATLWGRSSMMRLGTVMRIARGKVTIQPDKSKSSYGGKIHLAHVGRGCVILVLEKVDESA